MLIDNNASDTFTVIEVNGRDRPGFLHVVTRALTRLNLQIASAHITTYGERAVDVFYVKDLFGLKVVNQDKLKQIADTVEKSIRDFDARFEPIAEGGGIVPRRRRRPGRSATRHPERSEGSHAIASGDEVLRDAPGRQHRATSAAHSGL